MIVSLFTKGLLFATNPLYAAYADSDLLGKLIFLSLLALSIISWIIFFQKTWISKTMRKLALEFKKCFEKTKHHPLNVQINTLKQNTSLPNPLLDIYLVLKEQTLELLNKNKSFHQTEESDDKQDVFLSPSDIDLVASYLSTAVSTKTKHLEKNLFILSTIVTLGPFLGLLGTVWGILTTFSTLSSRAGSQSNDVILSGLAMALGTTILGLLVAIPALIAYNYLKNDAREFQIEMEDFSTLMLATVELQYRKVDVK
ncbi:MAG: MotA/TolQ/ExbB proton channel family protein [Chlamydiales bacterium]|nr:MotA/TolQ/ExbB proton channel family protein [Chlamydiales bacterium]